VGTILGTLASLIVGGAVATATVFGVVNAQTGPADSSPGSVSNPVVSYGSVNP
jgi:hypothetical protein